MLAPTKLLVLLVAAAGGVAASGLHRTTAAPGPESLVGAWREKVQFVTGPYAAVKDLRFLISFNEGGTLTESSNYDEAPPVTPAYGSWRKTGRNEFELHYEYFNSKAPEKLEALKDGWVPGGIGVLKEKVKVAADGQSYTSEIEFVLRDETGKVVSGGGKAVCTGEKMKF